MAIPTIDERDMNPYSRTVLASKNVIFRGAPGTGKTYLARSIAADIVSGGRTDRYDQLTGEEQKRVGFVQFHPSYDYTDFVEGLRPQLKGGVVGFERRDGIFMRFVGEARRNYEDAQKSGETLTQERSVQGAMDDFFTDALENERAFHTLRGNEFFVTEADDGHIRVSIPGNQLFNSVTLSVEMLRKLLESGEKMEKTGDVTAFFKRKGGYQEDSYYFILYREIGKRLQSAPKVEAKAEGQKNYVFIIDEINRGEISKILGELFFSIDPDYRGRAGEVFTQYANLHEDPEEKFYIPENVYIIGTMNDIDRSVDTFDFAMRRRFRFIELKAEDCVGMLDALGDKRQDAIDRMTALNKAILQVEELNENYQIGPAYFLKLQTLEPEQLWADYLQPLLRDYVQGMYGEGEIMKRLERAYNLEKGE